MFIELTRHFDDTKVLILVSTILQVDAYRKRIRDGHELTTRITTSTPAAHRPYTPASEPTQSEMVIAKTEILVSEDYNAVKFLLKLQGGI